MMVTKRIVCSSAGDTSLRGHKSRGTREGNVKVQINTEILKANLKLGLSCRRLVMLSKLHAQLSAQL